MTTVDDTNGRAPGSVPGGFPPSRTIEIPGRGPVPVRDSGGPGTPLVLLHGWMATADLNWGFTYPTLTRHFRVVAFDQRGHGRGLRGTTSRTRPFDLASCADDAVAVLDALAIPEAVMVGYSMGGPITLSVAHRHPDRVAAMVLCATAAAFLPNPIARLGARSLTPLSRLPALLPDGRVRRAGRERFISRRATGPWQDWISAELAPSDPGALLAAGAELARFDAWRWLRHLAMPSAVVVTTRDSLVRPTSQRALARGLPDVSVHEVDGDHLVCFDEPERFAPVLLDACRAVARPDGGAASD